MRKKIKKLLFFFDVLGKKFVIFENVFMDNLFMIVKKIFNRVQSASLVYKIARNAPSNLPRIFKWEPYCLKSENLINVSRNFNGYGPGKIFKQ